MDNSERGVLSLKIAGNRFTGWEEVTVQRSIETCAGGFSITVSDVPDWQINPNDECVVELDGEVAITGYVDAVQLGKEGSTHTISVSGRDKAGDLIDCSVVHKGNEFVGQSLLQIAQTLCKPFGIKVRVTTDVSPAFPKFAILPSESVWQSLERLARQRGVLIVSDGVGGVVFMQPNRQHSGMALVEGVNILSATATFNTQDRFSDYYIKGQTAGNDDIFGVAAAQIETHATDSGIKRYRPLIILSETNTSTATSQTRVNLEATTRAARSGEVDITVQGWQRDDNGKLWLPNMLVSCKVPSVRVSGDMLISSVNYKKSSQTGTTTSMKLARPDAFLVAEVTKKKDKVGGGSSYADILG